MDDKKRLGIFIVGAALIILVAMAVFVYIFNKKQQATPAGIEQAFQKDSAKLMQQAQNNKAVNYTFDATAEANRDLNSEDLRKLAQSFAERFGSYSNDGAYANFNDLRLFMTDKMQDWSDDYVSTLKKKNTAGSEYYGITTVAVSASVKSFDDKAGKAEIVVTTQRKEMVGTASPKVFSQDLTLNFVKTAGEWKVDGAFWEK